MREYVVDVPRPLFLVFFLVLPSVEPEGGGAGPEDRGGTVFTPAFTPSDLSIAGPEAGPRGGGMAFTPAFTPDDLSVRLEGGVIPCDSSMGPEGPQEGGGAIPEGGRATPEGGGAGPEGRGAGPEGGRAGQEGRGASFIPGVGLVGGGVPSGDSPVGPVGGGDSPVGPEGGVATFTPYLHEKNQSSYLVKTKLSSHLVKRKLSSHLVMSPHPVILLCDQ